MDELQDRRAIEDVITRYATGIDRKDWELFRSCFTADCTVRYGEGKGLWPAPGHFEDLDELVEAMEAVHVPVKASLHRMSNFVVAFTDQGATACSYIDAMLFSDAGLLRIVGFRDNDLVREDGEWKIRNDRLTLLWSEGDDAVLELSGPEGILWKSTVTSRRRGG